MPIQRRLPSILTRHSRHSSTFTNLTSTLKARTLPILYDYLTPQPSHLLTTTLTDHLPFISSTLPPHLPSTTQNPPPLPLAHHLVYFPTPTTPSSLLPDGTDTLHSPGPPYTNRLWAGGSVHFPRTGGPLLNGTRAAIVEGIRDVRISGPTGAEKVFIGIERRVAHVSEGEGDGDVHARVWTDDAAGQGDAILIERRDLCFLRPPPLENPEIVPTGPRRPIPPPSYPQFSHPLRPDPTLLFRFSALTYNAHAIHLDPLYTRTQYKQPDLLVHGPLLLTLMLTCLKHELEKSEQVVREITYRCLAPVYVGEGVRICGRRQVGGREGESVGGEGQSWEVWVEKGGDEATGEGKGEESAALVARGTVRTQYVGKDGS